MYKVEFYDHENDEDIDILVRGALKDAMKVASDLRTRLVARHRAYFKEFRRVSSDPRDNAKVVAAAEGIGNYPIVVTMHP